MYFKIDEKSLFYGIHNDFAKGQTATVHTPLNQSSDPNKWHNDILELTKHDIAVKNMPEMLVNKCLPQTTSKAKSVIDYFFEFKNLLLDGQPLDCNASFAMYIKREVDEFIIGRDGKRTKNTHFGRLKLHYPISLNFQSDGFKVNNKAVLESILKQNGGFAYVVRAFDYDLEKQTLNFITTMVGPKNINLSNVFKRAKGTGRKLLLEEIDVNDFELINEMYVVNRNLKDVDINTIFEKANKTKAENGKIGERIILEKLSKDENCKDVYHTSLTYPTSPYDIEYYENGVKKYVEVKSTQGDKKIFNMSMGEIKFMNRYKEDYILFLITNVKDKIPNIYMFTCEKIQKLKFEHPTTRFYA